MVGVQLSAISIFWWNCLKPGLPPSTSFLSFFKKPFSQKMLPLSSPFCLLQSPFSRKWLLLLPVTTTVLKFQVLHWQSSLFNFPDKTAPFLRLLYLPWWEEGGEMMRGGNKLVTGEAHISRGGIFGKHFFVFTFYILLFHFLLLWEGSNKLVRREAHISRVFLANIFVCFLRQVNF